jgi:uncharacterized protein YbcI
MEDQDNRQTTAEISNYISKMLRDHFGKGPEAVYVSIGYTFITIYIRNFISPVEKVLLKQKKEKTIEETRDAIMASIIPEIKTYVLFKTGMDIREFYFDWNLHNKSALFTGISSDETATDFPLIENYPGKEDVLKEMDNISIEVQKSPEEMYSCQLNERTLLLIRNGILVQIEKELIRLGYEEILKITKRSLEKSICTITPILRNI